MSWLRRRYLMIDSGGGNPADSYIQNGLVFQLDGIEKGSNTGYWTDRKGGITFPISGAASSGADHISFDGSGYITGSANISPSFAYDSMTIEVACTYGTGTGNRVVIICNAAPNFAFGFANAKKDIRSSSGVNKPIWSLEDLSAMKVYSITSDHALANINVSLTKGSNNSFANNSGNIEIGGRSYNNTSMYHGDVYAIRIYNRQLTLAEMAFNQAIDNERFQLGIVE